jgi:GTPase SAR1 family protein
MTTVEQDKEELDLQIKQVRTLLSQSKTLSEYFSAELDWLNRREKQWKDASFRIGLLGVTSAGKSTLVNALLDEKLLPDAVRPSSNSLVVCKWGEQAEGIVYFSDPAKKLRVICGSAIPKNLKLYADEASNPKNREGVEEIWLQSPKFRLGKGVALIDTPGLDAYGYDDHEKLTLEVLLPTVDIVLFLTTCKANSDEKVKEYVSLARDNHKPVIVVQNMIDSVVEKLGAHGHVTESKAQVLDKHLHRLQSVLKRAEVEAVSINQVSAIWALNGRLPESGLNQLIANIQSQLNALAPVIIEKRRTQLGRKVEEIVNRELSADNPALLQKHYGEDLVRLERQTSQVLARYAELERSLREMQMSLTREADSLRAKATSIGSIDVSEAYALKTRVEAWLRDSPAGLRDFNKQLIAQINEDCKTLNLQMGDIDLSNTLWRAGSSLNFETKEKSRKILKKQSGMWGSFKRKVDFFDAKWGLNEEHESWTEMANPGAFKAMIRGAIERELTQVENFVSAAIQRIQAANRQFLAEITEGKQGIQIKLTSVASLAQRKAIAQQLAALPLLPKSSPQSAPIRSTPLASIFMDEALHDVDVDPAAISMTKLATLISRRRFLDMRNQILDNSAIMRREHFGRVLILGFDDESVGDFVNRFWFDMLESDANLPIGFTSIRADGAGLSEIGVASLNAASEKVHSSVLKFLASPCVLFLLIDIQQIGASESLLHRSGIPVREEKHSIVAVVQSINELVHSNSIAEAFAELHRLSLPQGLPIGGAMVNGDAIWHSLLANGLLGLSGIFQTIADETQLIESLPVHARKNGGEIIRSWKELTCSAA